MYLKTTKFLYLTMFKNRFNHRSFAYNQTITKLKILNHVPKSASKLLSSYKSGIPNIESMVNHITELKLPYCYPCLLRLIAFGPFLHSVQNISSSWTKLRILQKTVGDWWVIPLEELIILWLLHKSIQILKG